MSCSRIRLVYSACTPQLECDTAGTDAVDITVVVLEPRTVSTIRSLADGDEVDAGGRYVQFLTELYIECANADLKVSSTVSS